MRTPILVLTIVVTLFVSCRNRDPNEYPRLPVQEQLSPVFSYIEIDGRKLIDVESSRCLSRAYQINRDFVGPVDDRIIILDISECDRMIGYAPAEYAEFSTWQETLRQWLLSWL